MLVSPKWFQMFVEVWFIKGDVKVQLISEISKITRSTTRENLCTREESEWNKVHKETEWAGKMDINVFIFAVITVSALK